MELHLLPADAAQGAKYVLPGRVLWSLFWWGKGVSGSESCRAKESSCFVGKPCLCRMDSVPQARGLSWQFQSCYFHLSSLARLIGGKGPSEPCSAYGGSGVVEGRGGTVVSSHP